MLTETFDFSLPATFSQPLASFESDSLPEADSSGLIRGLLSAMMIYVVFGLGVATVWKLWHLLLK